MSPVALFFPLGFLSFFPVMSKTSRTWFGWPTHFWPRAGAAQTATKIRRAGNSRLCLFQILPGHHRDPRHEFVSHDVRLHPTSSVLAVAAAVSPHSRNSLNR